MRRILEQAISVCGRDMRLLLRESAYAFGNTRQAALLNNCLNRETANRCIRYTMS